MKRSGRRRGRARTRAGTTRRRTASNPEVATQSIFAPPTPRTDIPFEIAGDHELELDDAPIAHDDHGSLEEPATMDPSAEDLLSNAARHAASCGEAERAIAIYRELLTLNPADIPARTRLALLLHSTGAGDSALAELDTCNQQTDAHPEVLITRGAILGTLGRYREAEADLVQAVELEPFNAEGHFNLGLLMSRRGLWSDALPPLRRSIELDPGHPVAYQCLGDALNHVDDLQGALQAYHRSVELGPDNGKALYGLGVVYDRLNQPEEAAQMYRRSREMAGR